MVNSYRLGLDYNLNIGLETTYGTFATTLKAFPGDVISFSPILGSSEELIGPIRSQNEADKALHGPEEYGFSVEFTVRDFEFLHWIMGEEGAVTGSDPYTHPLELKDKIPFLSVEAIPEDDYGSSFKFLGCKANTLTLKAAVGGAVIATMDFIAREVEIDETPASAAAENTSNIIEFHDVGSSGFTLNSITYGDVVELIDLAINRNLVRRYGLASPLLESLVEGKRSAIITADIRPSDETLVKLLIDKTDFAAEIELTDSASHKATFTFTHCKVFGVEQTVGEEALLENIPIRVIGDWTAETIDSIATYETT